MIAGLSLENRGLKPPVLPDLRLLLRSQAKVLDRSDFAML
jgi:hypothetical protein